MLRDGSTVGTEESQFFRAWVPSLVVGFPWFLPFGNASEWPTLELVLYIFEDGKHNIRHVPGIKCPSMLSAGLTALTHYAYYCRVVDPAYVVSVGLCALPRSLSISPGMSRPKIKFPQKQKQHTPCG